MIEGLDYAIAALKRGAARHKYYASGDYTNADESVKLCHFHQMNACLGAVRLLQNKRSQALRSQQKQPTTAVKSEPSDITPDYSNHPCVLCGKEGNCDSKCPDQE